MAHSKEVTLTGVIYRDVETDWYVALCPEVDVASQGKTFEEARSALAEAVTLFFESASPEEQKRRIPRDVFIAPIHAHAPEGMLSHA